MSIFRRNKDADRAAEPVLDEDADTAVAGDGVDGSAADEGSSGAAGVAVSRENGPFDVSEVSGRDGRVDLGALWVAGIAGMELRLEMDEQSQQVTAATAVLGESALQVQAFAAPRSTGLWADIRHEISVAVEQQGGTVEEADTDLGTELRTRMPSAGPDGRTVFAPATFIGVDGPRWFLRGVLSGRAAIDTEAAEPLLELFRGLVVVRGVEPMAPRELLPLSLPQDPQATPVEQPDDEPASLDPFERGPEITEVR
ncbi:DUF3710 domain-containing protein [Phycicoccus duodecadis]|uniref:Uncharacterized protein DUF3710 n=1 Tax=Phycicoccus duodecadis TaxID=173053 RepID=A0A2N3YFC9_9MICO|nr:DUF3710 domain-containing protein [Phycicoccus duodecadis]PKW25551.1 uncharacterized protein DUF3710 [Phycicoccus duodecadis]